MNYALIFLPIIISLLALVVSYITYKNEKQYYQKSYSFDKQKEVIRIQEKRIEDVIAILNSRSSLIPFFNLALNDEDIKVIENDKKAKLILNINIINIGKESAANIMLCPCNDNEDKNYYFKNNGHIDENYSIHDYLDNYYAFPKQCVRFSISTKLAEKDSSEIDSSEIDSSKIDSRGNISFKIKFTDLIGNVYEQEFYFIYGPLKDSKDDSSYHFSRESYSNMPLLVESNIKNLKGRFNEQVK